MSASWDRGRTLLEFLVLLELVMTLDLITFKTLLH